MKNIFTFTETNYQPSFYPGYVSINKHDDGQCSISVRQSGDTNGQSARIAVPAETLEHLASDIMAFFGAQDVDRPAPTSAGGMPASVQGVSEHETKCATCNGHGLVGGMMCWGDGEVDSIAEPCPDCQPAVPVQEPGLAEVVAKKTAEIEASGIKLWAYRPTDAQRYQRLRILGAAPGGSDNLERGTVLRFQSLDEYVDEDIAIRPSRGEAAQAAPSASGGYANGIEAAAKWVDQRRFDFEAENGGVDPETGALEFGTGAHALAKEEYDAELGEIADGIRSLAAATSAPSTPLPPPIFSQAHSDAMYRAGMILAGKIPQPSAPSVSAEGSAQHLKPVLWRRATRHSWEYRYTTPTALTRGEGWQALCLVPDEPADTIVSVSADATLHRIADVFGIGSGARTPDTILANIENAARRSQCLRAIEREFFMVTTEADDDYPDDEPGDECLLNWGADPAEYVEQFRAAIAAQSKDGGAT